MVQGYKTKRIRLSCSEISVIMGVKWALVFLLVASVKGTLNFGEQGDAASFGDSGAFFPRSPPPPNLANYFRTAIREDHLSDYEIVEEPDPIDYPDPEDYIDAVVEYESNELSRIRRSASYNSAQSYSSGMYTRCAGPEGYPGSCKPAALCGQYYATAIHFKYDSTNYYKSCTYGYGYHGVCCPDISYSGHAPAIITCDARKYGGYDGKYVNIPPQAIKQAVKYALDYHEKHYTHDQYLGRGEDDPSYWGNGVVKDLYMSELHDYGDLGAILALTSLYLYKTNGFRPDSYYEGGYINYNDLAPYLPYKYRPICESFDQKCYPSKYRSIDGSCNNLKMPYIGKSISSFGYICPPRYSDGVYKPRHSADHRPLHKVRPMRYNALPDKDVAERSVNMFFMTWGQMIAHDTTHAPFYQAEDGTFLDCCYGYRMGDEEVSDKCYAIALPPDDGFYKHHRKESQDCLNFARSMIAPNSYCTLGYASKLNRQTHYVDASYIYGISENETHALRSGKYGLLKFSKVGYQYYPPISKDAECFNSSQDFCFDSGDLRTTLQPGVVMGQIIGLRLHNYCAKKLYKINPHWNDDKLFYEARAITIAIVQHITYAEYLPLLLGWKFMYDYGILPPTKGYSYDYDPEVKPWTFHEFGGAAFRHHSAIYGKIILADEYYKVEKALPLQDYYNSAILYKNPYNCDKVLRGFMMTPQRKIDEYYDPAISDYLMKDERHFGLDLPTFNIKRGRDMGIGSYNDFREMCGLKRAYSWKDFYDVIDPEVVAKLSQYYRYPDDVDLYTGGVVERHIKDSYLGPTWWCIVGHQFQTWKRGDRYFYTHGGMPHSFSEAQLDEIRKMSMAAVVCATSYLKTVPTYPFRIISPGNPLVNCDDIYAVPRMSFAPWKEGY